ncbi:ATP-binding protein [Kaistella sp. DKR-2]|uniref:AAA family ATPase n=1 Tax=Kaistella soli TaxID=2849654 RepID=UPI001C263B85|nr:AAA family ATPase [Kaistella soli]MBU8882875.1 ATP-binding protein [Kaistella soli]
MKIAIAGAHRVGKTSLAEKLIESLPEYALIPEPYFELEERGYAFSEVPTLDDYTEQFEYSLKQIAIADENVIYDRCPLDLLAYIEAVNGSENIQSYYQKAQNAMIQVDLLVFVPIENPDLIVCPESELPELRDRVNEILSEWVGDFGTETLEVHGSLLERLDQVIGKLEEISSGDEKKE